MLKRGQISILLLIFLLAGQKFHDYLLVTEMINGKGYIMPQLLSNFRPNYEVVVLNILKNIKILVEEFG